jgi:hypothetical protein
MTNECHCSGWQSRGEKEIGPMRKLWIVSAIMVAAGLVLASASALAGLGPIALVCGVLLVWSGIIKVIVLRVWQKTLPLSRPAGQESPLPRVSLAPREPS